MNLRSIEILCGGQRQAHADILRKSKGRTLPGACFAQSSGSQVVLMLGRQTHVTHYTHGPWFTYRCQCTLPDKPISAWKQ